VITRSISYITSRIAVFANISISAFAFSFRSPETAPKGVSQSLKSRKWFNSPLFFIAVLMANKRSRILIDCVDFSLLKRIRLFARSESFLGSISLF
jgi:hypothetical protein